MILFNLRCGDVIEAWNVDVDVARATLARRRPNTYFRVNGRLQGDTGPTEEMQFLVSEVAGIDVVADEELA